MKRRKAKRFLSLLLAFIMLLGMIPTALPSAYAGHTCPECQEWIDGSPYCADCYACEECVDLCHECGICTGCSGSSLCEGCSDEEIGNMCVDCALEKGAHCPGCDACYFTTGVWCGECGMCEECSEYDEGCSNNLGEGILCVECAADKGSHCPGCGGCYFELGGWCEECGQCADCSEYDDQCSISHGQHLCFECAAETDTHCPECSTCYFKAGNWCEECMRCAECVEICNYCCEEVGGIICVECAIEQGLHCPGCDGCYGEVNGDFCSECYICLDCADICPTHEMCIDCTLSEGLHCPDCEGCGEDEVLCEGCGEVCAACAEDFCEDCNMCSECVLICQDCGKCEQCADICPNCEEYCSDCEGLCDDCGFCVICCEDIANFEGCDCGEWVCVESSDWDEHFSQNHTEAGQSHSARPSRIWTQDETYHWRMCVYCAEDVHSTAKAKHTYDDKGRCTVCYFVKDAKIQIIVQPRDSKTAYVAGANEENGERNMAHFSVIAKGQGKLTYNWCVRYSASVPYKPIAEVWGIYEPEEGENLEGPNLDVIVPTDACYREAYICCFITDEAGNEIKTNDVVLGARHDYHYFEQWRTHERPAKLAQRSKYGHVLECIGEGCEKTTSLRPHEDEERDGYCDICDYEIGKILITKQPKDCTNAYVYNVNEGYDESNIAHFTVEAVGESELTYTWYRRQYVNGQLTYVPLQNPEEGECYDAPELKLLVPEDSCNLEYTYCCFITDEEGNETKTVDVKLKAKHNYQYFEDYLSARSERYADARRRYAAHALVCVSRNCGKVTRHRAHEDENRDLICDICSSKKDLTEVGITVTVPKEGQKPDYNVATDHTFYRARGDSANYGLYRFWMVSDNGVGNWKIMDKNTAFVAGKYYKFIVDLEIAAGYEFPMYTYQGVTDYSFWVWVNGAGVKPKKAYNMDPARYVTVEYEFGVCNDSVIENIVIENAVTPVAGAKPAYSATVRGSGYQIDTAKNARLDDYWNTPQQKPHYIKNGIGWFDLTESDWVYENETFLPGHQYQINVYLKTEEGYSFYMSKYYEMLFTAFVNGQGAQGNTTTSDGLRMQTVMATFNCPAAEVSSVQVSGLATPVAGKSPDYTASVGNPALYELAKYGYQLGGFWWYDSENNAMTDEKFEEGKTYQLEIKLTPVMAGGLPAAIFKTPVSATVNGKAVDSDDITAGSSTVYITQYYTCRAPSTAPVSGSVISTGSQTAPITLQLFEKGKPEPAYETVVKGNSASYSFAKVPEGSYTLKASKENHVTAEYSVTVSNTPVICNVVLEPITYTVSFHPSGGSGTMASVEVVAGAYTLPVCKMTAPVGNRFKAWAVGSVSGTQKRAGEKITVSGDTTLYAIWESTAVTYYTVTFDSNGGSAVTAQSVAAGKKASRPADPTRSGYTFEGWTLNGKAYSFGSAVNGNITLKASWKKNEYSNPFTDVKKSDYYYTPVLWAVDKGVTTGTSAATFSPAAPCTRAQAVTFLWRAAGSPAPKGASNPFGDVKAKDYFYKAVLWAVENGVTTGTGKTTFSPNDPCTRGQIVTFLWRAQGEKKVSSANPFKDVKASDYYYNAVLWAVKNNVTTGTAKDAFSPADTCTRGQIVTFLYRAIAL